jgi:hypothetical protein
MMSSSKVSYETLFLEIWRLWDTFFYFTKIISKGSAGGSSNDQHLSDLEK